MISPARTLASLVTLCALLQTATTADDSPQTKALRARIDASRKSQVTVQKEISLKQAAVDIQRKRAAELEKQLKIATERAAEEAALLKKAQAKEAAAKKELAELAGQLKKHEAADQLLVTAAAAKDKVVAAEKAHETLVVQLADTRKSLFDQKQIETKAEADLKKAKEQLPKSKEELTKARAALDAAAKETDAARLAVTQAADELKAKQNALAPHQARVRKADAATIAVAASIKTLEENLSAVRAAAAAAGTSPDDAGAEIAASIEALKLVHAKSTSLVAAANAKVAEAQKVVAVASAAKSEAQTKFRELQNKYAELSRAHFKLQLQVADLQSAEPFHTKQIADAKAAQTELAAKQKELEVSVAAAAAETTRLRDEYVQQQRLAEAAMEPLGRFVSFSRHIAPIFAKRCVACHNTRTASGRLNMDSFAGILKGGESGVSVEAHKAEESLLTLMIEDGTMPKDADPLSKEQIGLIRKWIDAGAPLDAGIIATADLFQVMPETPQPLPPETYRVPIPVTATAFNPEGNILASSGYHEILLWNTDDNKLLRRITNVAERVYDLEFSADGTQLAVAAGTPGQLGEVKLFSVADGAHQKTLVRTKDAVFAVSFSPDGKFIAGAGADRVVYAIEVASGRKTLQIEDHADWVMDVNWSPDGKQLVTASRDKTSKVFNAEDGRSVITFNGHGNAVYSAVFLADGANVVSAGSDKLARVWKKADGKEVRKIGGFGSDIFRIAITPDNHLLSASADRTARQHNLADGKAVRTFAGHKDWVYTLSYNAKRKLVATGSYDGEIRVWNSEDGSVTRSFIAVPQASEKAAVAAAEE